MSGDLDSILNGEQTPEQEIETPEAPETPAEPEAVSEPTAEEPTGPVRDEKGRFAPKGETTGESPTPEKVDPPLDHAALLGERRRRQEAEDRIRALEAQINAPQAQVQQPVQQQPQGVQFDEDLYWSNPQQFLQNFEQRILQQVQGIVPQIVTGTTLDRAEAMARARHEDYDAARDAFYRVAIADQSIAQKAMLQPDPAEYAYQEGKRLLEMANYGSMNEYIEAEVARRAAAQQPQPEPTPAPVIPTSLADAPAAGPIGATSASPLSLGAIIGR